MKFKIYPALCVVATVALVAACSIATFAVKATTLKVISPNQGVLGDKPYLGTIQFRSTFGVANSTEVTSNTVLTTLGRHLKSGESVTIPESVGLNDFGTVGLVNKNDVENGVSHPMIAGIIYVAMEEDLVGKDQVSSALKQRATDLQSLLQQHVETGEWFQGLGLGLALQNVSDGLKSTTGGCGLLDTKLCHWFTGLIGDDLIGQGMSIFVNIDNAYFQEVADKIAVFSSEWPLCSDTNTPICPLQNSSFVIDLNAPGDGHYSLQATSALVSN